MFLFNLSEASIPTFLYICPILFEDTSHTYRNLSLQSRKSKIKKTHGMTENGGVTLRFCYCI